MKFAHPDSYLSENPMALYRHQKTHWIIHRYHGCHKFEPGIRWNISQNYGITFICPFGEKRRLKRKIKTSHLDWMNFLSVTFKWASYLIRQVVNSIRGIS